MKGQLGQRKPWTALRATLWAGRRSNGKGPVYRASRNEKHRLAAPQRRISQTNIPGR